MTRSESLLLQGYPAYHQEAWKPVSFPGTDGWYDVSTHGRIRTWRKAGRAKGRTAQPRVLRGSVTQGYPSMTMTLNDGGKKLELIHAVVLAAFVGPRPACEGARYVGAHWNDERTDNHLTNLRWTTPKENTGQDALRTGRIKTGEESPRSSLTNEQVHAIRCASTSSESRAFIASCFGVSATTVHRILTGKSWGHVPWRFPCSLIKDLRKKRTRYTRLDENDKRKVRDLFLRGNDSFPRKNIAEMFGISVVQVYRIGRTQ